MKKALWCILWVALSSPAMARGPSVVPMNQLKMQGIERQTLDYSCGAAALSILLSRYYKIDVSETDILFDMILRKNNDDIQIVMREGFSLYDLKESVERLGFSASGIMLNADTASKLNGPVILLLRNKVANHFVVLRGISQGRAFITDPALGHYRIPLYELEKKWKGETLVVERDGFDLPTHGEFGIPSGKGVASEQDVVRALRNKPLN
jgi:predicted double-glycine peptidase